MQFFKPNSKKTGHACDLSFNSKEQALWIQFIKQTSWDDSLKRGAFKGGAKFNIKLNAMEIGAILNCVERARGERLFHKAEKGSTSIELKEFIGKDQKTGEPKKDGITISVNPRANEGEEKPQTFGFWFNAAEARVLKGYLDNVLSHFFDADYSEQKKMRAEYAKKREEQGGASPAKKDAVEEAPKQADDSDPFA